MSSKFIYHIRVLRRSIVLYFTIIQPRPWLESSSPLFSSFFNYNQRLKFPSSLPINQTRHQYGCYSNPHTKSFASPLFHSKIEALLPLTFIYPPTTATRNLTFIPRDRILAQWAGTMPQDGLMLLLLSESHIHSSRSLRIPGKPPSFTCVNYPHILTVGSAPPVYRK
jgi:hypothetical protein